MKQILVPTDFSKTADGAFRVACEIAKRRGARIVVHNVYGIPYDVNSIMIDVTDVLQETAENSMKDFLSAYKKDYPELEIEGTCSFGTVADTIFKKAIDFDLVVMGTNGSSGLEEFFIGSNTASVISQISKTPILSIPNGFSFLNFKSAILALSSSDQNQKETLDDLVNILEDFGIENIEAVSVQKEDKTTEQERETFVKDITKLLSEKKHTINFLEDDDVESALLNYASPQDLIVVVAKKHSFFDSLFHKSISKRLAMHSQNALLVLKDI